jgi:hypothetical protein
MANFDLKIIQARKSAVVIADSEFGEATACLSHEFLSEMSRGSQALRQLYHRMLRQRLRQEEEVSKFGEKLFNGIFQSEVLDLFNRTLGGATDGQLNIRLMLGNPALNTIQWEVMRFRGEYIGFRHNLFRHPFVLRPAIVPREPKKTVQVLYIAVDPVYGVGTVHREQQSFINIMQNFGNQINLMTLLQEDATVDNIIELLFRGVDILHFTGHGLFDNENPLESALVVWPKNPAHEQYDKLSVRSLRTITTSQNVGFCFLNACDTGRAPDPKEDGKEGLANAESMQGEDRPSQEEGLGEYFVSMAHSLIEAGIPMVVATNHEISVEAATRLSHRFYTSIIKYGKRVDQAVREARAELYLGGPNMLPSDWSCPVLYTRSRYNELGTERLYWEATDIYSIRNIEKPVEIATRLPPP